MGAITYWASKYINPKNIYANELSPRLAAILKKLQPNINITQGDFLTKNVNDYKNIRTIYCNPPFTTVGNKTFYLDFLFKCLEILNNNKGNSQRLYDLVFICPRLVNKNLKKGDLILMENIVDKYPEKRIKDILEKTSEEKFKGKIKKQIMEGEGEASERFDEYFYTSQIQLIDICKGFGGTNITADMYRFIV